MHAFNCEETYLPLNVTRQKLVARRNKNMYAQAHGNSEHIILLCGCSAAGIALPLMIIFSKSFPGGHIDSMGQMMQYNSVEKIPPSFPPLHSLFTFPTSCLSSVNLPSLETYVYTSLYTYVLVATAAEVREVLEASVGQMGKVMYIGQ